MTTTPVRVPSPPPARRPVLTPLVLSALVCPGAGQFMQRRWISGAFFVSTFTAAFVWFAARVLMTLKAYYEFAFNFAGASGQAPGIVGIVVPFGVCLVLYVAGLIDTALGNRRGWRGKEI